MRGRKESESSAPACANCWYRVEMSANRWWNGTRVARCFYWEPLLLGAARAPYENNEPCKRWRLLGDMEAAFRRWLLALSQDEWEAEERRKLEVIR